MHRFAALSFATLASLTAPALVAQKAPLNAPPNGQSGKEPFALSRLARDGGRFGMLLRQFRADEPTLPDRCELGRREAMAEYRGAHDLPAAHWVWVKPFWFLFRDGPGDAKLARQWGPEQACGEPDTKEAGDLGTAWASREQDARGEWLLLEYATPVRAASVEIHETFNPGALEAIAILDPAGAEIEVWRAGAAPTAVAEPGRVLKIDLPLGFTVERLKLYLRSEAVPGWNEIDAVGLRDDKGVLHWAARAEAASTYADAAPAAAAPALPGPVVMRQAFVRAQVQAPPANVQFLVPQRAAVAPNVQLVPARLAIPQLAAPLPAANAETEALRKQVADLEAKVKALQAELDQARAGKH